MSYEIELRGGPHDGERVEVLNPPAIGAPILELGSSRAPYRLTVTAGTSSAVGEYVPSPGHRPWTFDAKRGEWVAGDVVPAGAALSAGEAGLAIIVGSSMGVCLAVGALAVYVLGWTLDFLAERLGGWLNTVGLTAIAGAVVCLVWALIDPDMVRQPIRAESEGEE